MQSLLFARAAPAFASEQVARGVAGAGEKPSGQHLVPGKVGRLARQIREDDLRRIGGELGSAIRSFREGIKDDDKKDEPAPAAEEKK